MAIVLALVVSFFLWTPAEAKKKKRKRRKPKSEQIFYLDTGLDIGYDDNIINYSDGDLDLYGGGTKPGKYDIKSADDLIVNIGVSPRVKGKFIKGKTAWLSLRYNYFFYAQNDIRRFSKIALDARHYAAKGVYFDLEYSYLPEYYYRNEFDGVNYIPATFSKHFIKAEYGMNLRSDLKADVSYRYQKKTFNPEFSERDLTVHGMRLDGIWTASKRVKFWAFYGFEGASASGADDPDLTVKDVSYNAWDMTLGCRYYSRRLRKIKPEIAGSFQYRRISYQTLKYIDLYRFGRGDNNFQYTVETAFSLRYKVRMVLEYKLQQKRTGLVDPAVKSLLDYNSNSISLKLRRNF